MQDGKNKIYFYDQSIKNDVIRKYTNTSDGNVMTLAVMTILMKKKFILVGVAIKL